MKELYIYCPKCSACLVAEANVDYFETRCACCEAEIAVRRDHESKLCDAWVISRWTFPLKFLLP